MKKFLIWCLICPIVAFSQKTHTVDAKETLFSIGRKYNVHPRELASYNNIPFETGLTIGQVIKIPGKTSMPPLPKDNVVQTEPKPVHADTKPTTTSVPVYHVVAPKETLYQISKKNKTTVADIKKWNKLSADALKTGTKLIVGYKKETVKPQQSVATSTTVMPVIDVPLTNVEEKPVPEMKKKEPVAEVKKETIPEVSTHVNTVIKEEVKPAQTKPLTGEGFFSTAFTEQITGRATLKEDAGLVSVFKSTSGWEDGKYYCLYNKAEPGTIIKLTHKETKQTIFAKVLDVMPDMKQHAGIVLRISNAAADKLGASTETFECIITY